MMTKRDSQCTKILRHLQRNRRLTPLDALTSFGCMRLAARIRDLRKAGNRIITERITLQGISFAQYRIAK